jgi:hypothetical protein
MPKRAASVRSWIHVSNQVTGAVEKNLPPNSRPNTEAGLLDPARNETAAIAARFLGVAGETRVEKAG